jgi:Domain of unknown function (DUF4145)
MAVKFIAPKITAEAFSCPHCGALADQTWYRCYADHTEKGEAPQVWTADQVARVKADLRHKPEPEVREALEHLLPFLERRALGMPFFYQQEKAEYLRFELANIFVSECYSCEHIAIWRFDSLLHPTARHEVEPNPDLDADIRVDFDEARAVFASSPRAAAALLRLCVEKLCKQLGMKGKNIDDDIGALVAKGLPVAIQQALDLVRVIGNKAVHPGHINLNDDRETAAKLFELVNLIADNQISQPKAIAKLFDEKVPPGAKAAIARRDGV